ncbi:MAG TPA: carboxypeptidase regulatory-like domain-containing protein, partial [Pyrinomonadaceae bacterium]|nr:carboxypeptidase regulatory-like domain-containing protein [Pyrinomonadaceae bacterium]
MPSLIGRFIAVATLLFFAASLSTPLAWAQNSAAGTLTGLIVDEVNNPIAGAIATITNLGTGNTDSRRTDTTGRYRFDYKPAGRYRVEAEKDGYVSYFIESYLVQLNYTNIIELPRITLRRAAANTPPDRLESLPPSLVNTADASRGGNFSQREFDALPIGGATVMRSFDEYAFL